MASEIEIRSENIAKDKLPEGYKFIKLSYKSGKIVFFAIPKKKASEVLQIFKTQRGREELDPRAQNSLILVGVLIWDPATGWSKPGT